MTLAAMLKPEFDIVYAVDDHLTKWMIGRRYKEKPQLIIVHPTQYYKFLSRQIKSAFTFYTSDIQVTNHIVRISSFKYKNVEIISSYELRKDEVRVY